MGLLKTFVVCAVMLVGMTVRAEDAVRADDSPAAEPSSGAPLPNAYHQAEQQGAEGMGGSDPSAKSDYAPEPDYVEQTSSSDIHYFPSGSDDYEPAYDYWASDEYECEDYDYSDPYNYNLYASEWFSEGHDAADVKESEATKPGTENTANPEPSQHTPAGPQHIPAAKTAGKAARGRAV